MSRRPGRGRRRPGSGTHPEETTMPRMTIDCRSIPSGSGCSLTLSGEEDEVMRAAVAHAVDVHRHADGEELRAGLRASLVPETAALTLEEGAFVQVIEFRTT